MGFLSNMFQQGGQGMQGYQAYQAGEQQNQLGLQHLAMNKMAIEQQQRQLKSQQGFQQYMKNSDMLDSAKANEPLAQANQYGDFARKATEMGDSADADKYSKLQQMSLANYATTLKIKSEQEAKSNQTLGDAAYAVISNPNDPEARQTLGNLVGKDLSKATPIEVANVAKQAEAKGWGGLKIAEMDQKEKDFKQRQTEQAQNHQDSLSFKRDMLMFAKSKQDGTSGVNLSEKARDLKDELIIKDPSFLSRLSKGGLAERNRTIEDWALKGYSADDIISGRIEVKGQIKEVQTLANQKAGIERAETAISMNGGIGDQLIEASKRIDPSKFRGYNKISQLLQSETSDPDLAAYKIKLIALRDEFATVINKGGIPTDASRAQASEIMDQYAPTAMPAIIKAVKDIAKVNQNAINQNMDSASRGSDSAVNSGSSASTPEHIQNLLDKYK